MSSDGENIGKAAVDLEFNLPTDWLDALIKSTRATVRKIAEEQKKVAERTAADAKRLAEEQQRQMQTIHGRMLATAQQFWAEYGQNIQTSAQHWRQYFQTTWRYASQFFSSMSAAARSTAAVVRSIASNIIPIIGPIFTAAVSMIRNILVAGIRGIMWAVTRIVRAGWWTIKKILMTPIYIVIGLRRLAEGLRNAAGMVTRFFLGIRKGSRGMDAGDSLVQGLLGVVGFGAVSLGVASLTKQMVKSNDEFEKTKLMFASLLTPRGIERTPEVMAKAREEADKLVARLQQFDMDTPFEEAQLLDATRRLMRYTDDWNEIEEVLTSVGDAMAGTGNVRNLGRVMYAAENIMARGKAYGQEMQIQLQSAGIYDGWNALARVMGKTVQQVKQMNQAGRITRDNWMAWLKELGAQSKGMMKTMSEETVESLTGIIQDWVRISVRELGTPIWEQYLKGLRWVKKMFESPEFSQAIASMANNIRMAFNWWNKFIETPMGKMVYNLATVLGTMIAIRFTWRMAMQSFGGVLGHIRGIAVASLPAAALMAALAWAWRTATAEGARYADSIKQKLDLILPALYRLWDAVKTAAGDAFASIQAWIIDVGSQWGVTGESVEEVIGRIADKMVDLMIDTITWAQVFIENWRDIGNIAVAVLELIWAKIKDMFTTGSASNTWIKQMGLGIVSIWDKFLARAIAAFNGIVGFIRAVFPSVWDFLGELLSNTLISALADLARELGHMLQKASESYGRWSVTGTALHNAGLGLLNYATGRDEERNRRSQYQAYKDEGKDWEDYVTNQMQSASRGMNHQDFHFDTPTTGYNAGQRLRMTDVGESAIQNPEVREKFEEYLRNQGVSREEFERDPTSLGDLRDTIESARDSALDNFNDDTAEADAHANERYYRDLHSVAVAAMGRPDISPEARAAAENLAGLMEPLIDQFNRLRGSLRPPAAEGGAGEKEAPGLQPPDDQPRPLRQGNFFSGISDMWKRMQESILKKDEMDVQRDIRDQARMQTSIQQSIAANTAPDGQSPEPGVATFGA